MYLEDMNLFIGNNTMADSNETKRTAADTMYCVSPRIICLSKRKRERKCNNEPYAQRDSS